MLVAEAGVHEVVRVVHPEAVDDLKVVVHLAHKPSIHDKVGEYFVKIVKEAKNLAILLQVRVVPHEAIPKEHQQPGDMIEAFVVDVP